MMAGHSKWANTKHRKAKVDQARAKIFSRLVREITIASKLGDSDSASNARLRIAILKAKSANVPSKNIEATIAKGNNDNTDESFFEPVYEGYGPGGISIMVHCITNNKTRTVANIRFAFNKFGGQMGESGSVAWMFDMVGLIEIDKSVIEEDTLLELLLDKEITDLQTVGDVIEVLMPPSAFQEVLEILQAKEIKTLSAEVTEVPQNKMDLNAEQSEKALKLLDALDNDEDVQRVVTNAKFSNELEE